MVSGKRKKINTQANPFRALNSQKMTLHDRNVATTPCIPNVSNWYDFQQARARPTYTQERTYSRSNHTPREHPHQCRCSSSRLVNISNRRTTHNKERCSLEGSEDPENEVSWQVGRDGRCNRKYKEEKTANKENLQRPKGNQ